MEGVDDIKKEFKEEMMTTISRRSWSVWWMKGSLLLRPNSTKRQI